jgi:hypothetical protein
MASSDYEKSKGESPSPSVERENTFQDRVPTHQSIQGPGTGEHPTYMGMSGRNLSTTVSIVATTGFLLFGYDRMYNIPASDSAR